ncbi:hypothetical protein [Alloalcanivorax xenomutans]|uniref:hypothetical protein n=1 Tax=Alloalcanivorax xenomutans TaxID=1094342 RepID=UPI0011AB4D83|nr:hypothetical protein [Alloalcanivorax xenomutans]
MAEAAKLGKRNAKEIYEMTKQVQIRLFAFGLLPALALMIGGEALFAFFLAVNGKWLGSFRPCFRCIFFSNSRPRH